jgi:hypothetical protein
MPIDHPQIVQPPPTPAIMLGTVLLTIQVSVR